MLWPRSRASVEAEGCCAEEEEEQQPAPALAGAHECGGCCFELGSDGVEFPTLPPAAGVQDPGPAAPMLDVTLPWSAPVVRRLTPRPIVPPRRLPGRAPTPLRI